ncbi:UNVERIFIED_CONTAM: hypothetical protein Sradi_2370300 [Sesamum radiatum]|uniref:Transmembrane protein n=1 Tax=Sesamum radiatum TaxID=300843 RepID=A0AAW2T600_SESRA
MEHLMPPQPLPQIPYNIPYQGVINVGFYTTPYTQNYLPTSHDYYRRSDDDADDDGGGGDHFEPHRNTTFFIIIIHVHVQFVVVLIIYLKWSKKDWRLVGWVVLAIACPYVNWQFLEKLRCQIRSNFSCGGSINKLFHCVIIYGFSVGLSKRHARSAVWNLKMINMCFWMNLPCR